MSQVRNQIHTDIPSQFPAIYREDGEFFVNFVEAYYEYIDNKENNYREVFKINDIDTTYERFLIHFRDKFMDDLPLGDDKDFRFLIKHIQDLYRRKGTEESLQLFFQMFFNEEVEVTYPSFSILKPSDSKYGSNFYLEMKSVLTIKNYPIRKGDRIKGDTSKAEAFVDTIVFYNFNGVMTPVMYLSNLSGRFTSDDGLVVIGVRENDIGEFEQQTLYPGKIINGSISNVSVITQGRAAGNKVGQILDIKSNRLGLGGRALVDKVSETATGVIEFKLLDGGFGYSANVEENTVDISTQTFILTSSTPIGSIEDFAAVTVSNNTVVSDGTNSTDFSVFELEGSGEVIGYTHPLIFVKSDANTKFVTLNTSANTSLDGIPQGGLATIDIEGIGSVEISTVSPYNESANFEIGSLENVETVRLISDLLSDYETTPLNSIDYEMSGDGPQTVATRIRDAFAPREYQIGQISSLLIRDNGLGYQADVASILKQDDILKFDKRDIGIIFDSPTFLIQQGDIITQVIQIEDLSYPTENVDYIPYTVKAKFIRRDGNTFYFRYITFYEFDNDLPITIANNTYNIISIVRDEASQPMGRNAFVLGESLFETGQVEEVTAFEAGFKYGDGETVELVNSNGVTVANAVLRVRDTGATEGVWTTSTSFLNSPNQVIRDNFYYQEYSYDISSIINPSEYEYLTRSLIQVAGTKQFSSPLINSSNDIGAEVDVAIEIYNLALEQYITANGDLMLTETDEALVAVVATLDQTETDTLNEDIND